jgi:hypothetical protein
MRTTSIVLGGVWLIGLMTSGCGGSLPTSTDPVITGDAEFIGGGLGVQKVHGEGYPEGRCAGKPYADGGYGNGSGEVIGGYAGHADPVIVDGWGFVSHGNKGCYGGDGYKGNENNNGQGYVGNGTGEVPPPS